jgi:hypothetical protein
MPSSEELTPAVKLTRSFWLGLIAGLVILSSLAGLNILVDPTGEFGQSGRHAFNRAPPPEVVALGEAGGNPAFFARTIRESQATYFLVGSSRTRRGFDTCDRPDVLRLAGSSWSLPEFRQIQRLVLVGRRKPVTLLMEVGPPNTLPPVINDPTRAAISVALSPQTTVRAFQTITHSLSDAPAPPVYVPCRVEPSPLDWEAAAVASRNAAKRLDPSPRGIRSQERFLLEMAELTDAICVREGVRHTIVFYTLPNTPPGAPGASEARLLNRNSERLSRVFALRHSATNGCHVRFVDLATEPPGEPAERAQWLRRENWLDYTHFSHRLGTIALEVLAPRNEAASANRVRPPGTTARAI